MADIKVENITKQFGKEVALDDVTLEVKNKEFFVLFGPAGAGKTTLLNVIAGFYIPENGHVYVDGDSIDHVEPEDRNIAMVFEDYALYPHLSVYENIASPLKSPRYRKPKEIVDQEVKRVAKMLRIDHLLDRRPSELSNGQRQRVGLGRALVRSPEVFLMDEPITHLDAKLRHQMRAELKDMQKNLDTTTIYVTHDYMEALSLGDRIAVINKGRIEQIGTPKEIYFNPVNIFVASAFGEPEMNFIDGEIVEENDQYFFKIDHYTLPLLNQIEEHIRRTKIHKLKIGIRPSNIEYSLDKKDDHWIQGKVVNFELLGAKAILTLAINQLTIRLVVSPDLNVNRNERMYIKLNMDHAIFFDEDGMNIFHATEKSVRREHVWEN